MCSCICTDFDLSQFIDVAMLVATVLAVLVALFGDAIRARCFGAKLEISLEKEPDLNITNGGVETWYYHLLVHNKRKITIANNATVFLTSVCGKAEGLNDIQWTNELPLRWIYSEVYNTFSRNIGADQRCDLLRASKEGVSLQLMFPTNNLRLTYTMPFDLFFAVVVKSDQYTTKPMTIHATWDGQWSEKYVEMAKHLVISLEEPGKKTIS